MYNPCMAVVNIALCIALNSAVNITLQYVPEGSAATIVVGVSTLLYCSLQARTMH